MRNYLINCRGFFFWGGGQEGCNYICKNKLLSYCHQVTTQLQLINISIHQQTSVKGLQPGGDSLLHVGKLQVAC